MRAVVWGTGWAEEQFSQIELYNQKYNVIAYIDSNSEKWNTQYRGKVIYPPEKIKELKYDMVIICMKKADQIYSKLIEEFCINRKNIITFEQICISTEKELCMKLSQKYSDSQNEEVRKVIQFYQNNGFNIFGYYKDEKDILYQVYYDEEEYPYIIFEGKRMYFPKAYKFAVSGGKQYVKNILSEQDEHSPHLYLKKGEEIKKGSVVVDAGAAEGNFALRYIDKIKKLYLIESDITWMNALKRTFNEYQDKVVFCNKLLGRFDNNKFITLDNLVKENVDFIKMDIEGFEVDALLGGRKLLENSNARCSICSYHKQNDEKYIRYLLSSYGYDTSCSEGYMFFIYDEDVIDTLDLRKGVVYAEKKY